MLQQLLLERIINGEDMTKEWKEAKETSIFKKDKTNKCKNENCSCMSVISTMGRDSAE